MAQLEADFPLPFGIFETALSASVTTTAPEPVPEPSTGNLPNSAYLADFIPAGETLTLTYTVR